MKAYQPQSITGRKIEILETKASDQDGGKATGKRWSSICAPKTLVGTAIKWTEKGAEAVLGNVYSLKMSMAVGSGSTN